MQRTFVLSELRIAVTGASVDYVGSVTVHEELCDALGLLDRQMVHIRNERTGVDLWTYVIRGLHCPQQCPHGTLCLNGAAAHLVRVGDIVSLTARGLSHERIEPRRWDAAQNGVTNVILRMGGSPIPSWCKDVVLEYACGKVHRPRITDVLSTTSTPKNQKGETSMLPALVLDQAWAEKGNIFEGEAIHLVNVTNGQRDIVTVQYAPAGSQQCAIHNIGNISNISKNMNVDNKYPIRPGYKVGDVVIAMNYAFISRGAIITGKAPPMNICFPFEKPNHMTPVTHEHHHFNMVATPTDTKKEQQDDIINEFDLHALWKRSKNQEHVHAHIEQPKHQGQQQPTPSQVPPAVAV